MAGRSWASRELIDALRYSARPFMFTASNTPGSIAGALTALRILRANPHYAAEVRTHAACFAATLKQQGFSARHSGAAIVTVSIGPDFYTGQAWKMLWNHGIFCNAAVSPAVPRDTARCGSASCALMRRLT